MINIHCIGNNFAHSTSSTLDKIPKHIEWKFNSNTFEKNDIIFFIDESIIDSHLKFDKNNFQIYGWLLESKCLNHTAKKWILNNLELCKKFFISIFTFDKELLDLDDLFVFLPAYGTYIKEFKEHEKTKLVSMITSNKNFAPLHDFRNKFAQNNYNKFDLFGRGYNEILTKDIGLNSYMFSVAIENDSYNYYYTEKLTDCFATKTIPIYMGSPIITPFNEKGVIRLMDNFDFSLLNIELYSSMKEYVDENFEKCKEIECLDDYLYQKYLYSHGILNK